MRNSKSSLASRLFRLSFALAFILPWSATSRIANTSVSQETGSLSLELLAPAYHLQSESEGLTSIQVEGFTSAGAPGELALPHRVLQVALPPQADLNSVTLEISNLQVEALPGVYQIQTLPPDSPDNTLSARMAVIPPIQQAAAPGFARLLSSGQMRKWRFASLDHSPFAYDPASGELSLASRVLVTIHYKLDPSAADPALLSDDLMDDLAQSKFYNYDLARVWYPQVDTPNQPGAVYDYVIITTNAIEAGSNKLDDFILHKQNRGFSVLTITESEYGGLVGQSPNGSAEKIRKWLKDNYVSFGIHYVLLVGNPDPDDPSIGDTVGDLPMKMCWPRRTASDSYKESPTDYFFSDLTGNWDKDGDGYFGEYTEDMGTGGVDFAPEVYVGRIPVYSSAYSTLDAVLQKIMDYENEANPLAWRKSALLPMSFGDVGYDGAPLSEQMMDDYLDGAGFASWTQYQQGSGMCSLDSIYASSETLRGGTVVRDRWAANDFGLVLWWGHGSETTAAVGYESCWDGTLFDTTQTSSLDDDHPSFIYQNSCTNGYPENASNLQYSLLKQGAVAAVSATRVSWFNQYVFYGDFDSSTTNAGIGYEYAKRLAAGQSAAEALYDAKSSMNPDQATRVMNYYDFNLYGDPATYLLPLVFPTNLSASAISQTQIDLSWTDTNSIEIGYTVERSSNGFNGWAEIASLISNSNSYSNTSLNCENTYYYRVRAYNAYGISPYSNSTHATTLSCAPNTFNKTSPANGVTNLPTTLSLTWQSTSPVTRYEYCYDTSNDNSCSHWIDNALLTSASLIGLGNNTTYYWHVRAWNGTIGPTYSDDDSVAFWYFTTQSDPGLPPSEFNKTSPGNAATDQSTSLTLSWQSTSPVTRYEYCYDTSNDNSCANWTNNNMQTSASLGRLSNNTTYYWQVRAWNGSAVPTYANSGSWWNFTVGSGGQAINDYLPLVIRNAPSSSLVNGDFEQGPGAGWQEYSSLGYELVVTPDELIVPPHGGSWAAWLGGANNETSRLYQLVTVPASSPTLTFWYWIGSTESCGYYYDTGSILLGGATLVQYDLCTGSATGGWVLQNINLNTYAGQTLELEFQVVTNSSNNSNLFIDDVSFEGGGALSEVPAVPPGQEAWLKSDK